MQYREIEHLPDCIKHTLIYTHTHTNTHTHTHTNKQTKIKQINFLTVADRENNLNQQMRETKTPTILNKTVSAGHYRLWS